jgi:hypothetical protein
MPFVLIEIKRGKQRNDKNNQKSFGSHVSSARQSGTRIERFVDANGGQTQQ